MLKKRSRSVQKDQYKGHLMSDSPSDSCLQLEKLGQKQKNTSFFSVPGLLVGFNVKGVSDSDSVRSPTSPLDYKAVSNLGNKKSGLNGSLKSWDCNKVGLGILEALDRVSNSSENVVQSSGSRNILFGSQMRMMNMNIPSSSEAPKSLPNNYAVFPQTGNDFPSPKFSSSETSCITGEMHSDPKPLRKFQSVLSDSSRSMSRLSGISYWNYDSSSENFYSEKKIIPGFLLTSKASNIDDTLGMKPSSLTISICSGNGLVGSLSASDIELSEDYTCIISHGPNPRTTHIFGDCVLDCHTNELLNFVNKKEEQGIGSPQAGQCSNSLPAYPSDGFLSVCFYCKEKLEEGKDIYMYRGEKSFCSCACRDQEMLAEEEIEKLEYDSPGNSPKSTCSDDIFAMGII